MNKSDSSLPSPTASHPHPPMLNEFVMEGGKAPQWGVHTDCREMYRQTGVQRQLQQCPRAFLVLLWCRGSNSRPRPHICQAGTYAAELNPSRAFLPSWRLLRNAVKALPLSKAVDSQASLTHSSGYLYFLPISSKD